MQYLTDAPSVDETLLHGARARPYPFSSPLSAKAEPERSSSAMHSGDSPARDVIYLGSTSANAAGIDAAPRHRAPPLPSENRGNSVVPMTPPHKSSAVVSALSATSVLHRGGGGGGLTYRSSAVVGMPSAASQSYRNPVTNPGTLSSNVSNVSLCYRCVNEYT